MLTNHNRENSSPFLSRLPLQPQSPHRSKLRAPQFPFSSTSNSATPNSFQATQHFHQPIAHNSSIFSTGNTSTSHPFLFNSGKYSNEDHITSSNHNPDTQVSFFQSHTSSTQGGSGNTQSITSFSDGFASLTSSGAPASASEAMDITDTHATTPPTTPQPGSPIRFSPRSVGSPLFSSTPPSPSYCSRFIPSRQYSPIQMPTTPLSSPSRSRRKLQFDTVSDSMRRDPTLDLRSSEEDRSQPPRDAYDDMLRREFWTDQRILKFDGKRPLTSRMVESPQKILRERLAMHKNDDSQVSTSKRNIASAPIKVLDAPALIDDFYLNLVDWGRSNILAVGLSDSVYLWNASTCKVVKLCTLPNNQITSVSWMSNGTSIAVGNAEGSVLLYDVTKLKCTRNLVGHTARVGCLSWNGNVIASGSRDRVILNRDIRVAYSDNLDSGSHSIVKLCAHKQEVCGLKWSPDGKELASGGNDNNLMIWNPAQKRMPMLHFTDHQAAVKGIAWSPHRHGLLASGGGTADRCIRFWNTSTGTALHHIDTGSQVCNITWSENVNELVSTHGYSQNQIVVWKYPSMTPQATLTGHSLRVLYLSMSPDGQTIVTGAGDETLRLWNVFPPAKTTCDSSQFGSNFACIR